ncbi:MAG: hypothetical protein Q7R67_00980 [bacterium]|nr:hypothetical protein [bacterium]
MVRHSELDRHYQNIILRKINSIVSDNFLNNILLQEPAYPSAINWITREAIHLPTNNSLHFAFLNPPEHFFKDNAAGFLGAALFDKFFHYLKTITTSNNSELGDLRFDREDLLVLDIS